MRLAIVGSREFENYDLVCEKVAKIQETQKIDLIVSGGAKGADTLAKKYAALNHNPSDGIQARLRTIRSWCPSPAKHAYR